MAIPKVFISSTYYDLKQERDNIARFIKDLGYEPIMHERAGVTYTQNEPLEKDCYNEIENCEILVCIIGNHFGSQSLGNDYSITMNELKSAMKDRKKIFIFIAKDVFVENETYLKNRDNADVYKRQQKKYVVNQSETLSARERQHKMQDEFRDWIFSTPERREDLERTYNRLFNQIRLPKFDGSHLKFPNMNPYIQLYPHQVNAVQRILTNGSTLDPHRVGYGKTFTTVSYTHLLIFYSLQIRL